MSLPTATTKVSHPIWGAGSLVRVEGTDWIVFFDSIRRNLRISAEARKIMVINGSPAASPLPATDPIVPTANPTSATRRPTIIARSGATNKSSSSAEAKPRPINADGSKLRHFVSATLGKPPTKSPPKVHGDVTAFVPGELPAELASVASQWHMRRAIESLANGLPPRNQVARYLAVDFEVTNRTIGSFLSDVSEEGGGAAVVRGSYGQGKTFTLNCLEEVALDSGFLVVRTEADAKENRLNRPDQIYRSLMRNLRIPGHEGRGSQLLVKAVVAFLKTTLSDTDPRKWRAWLHGKIGCHHWEWLFSDPFIETNSKLLSLVANERGVSAGYARSTHVFPGTATDWTALSDGTLGDFTSFLLSGLGRLAKLMGHRGLVVIIDEMEKWQELNLLEQSRASSFVCGLIWAATAAENREARDIRGLNHNRRFWNGSPFSTVERCHVGFAIAMTPRSEEDDPQQVWAQYGPLLNVDLPRLTAAKLRDYCCRVAPVFTIAYGCRSPSNNELAEICLEAVSIWKSQGDMTNRSAVQSAVTAFQNWREKAFYSEV